MNADKIVKFVEYIGTKEEKRAGGAVFKANADFGGRKVAIVDRVTAEALLRFPTVFREIDVQKLARESVQGGNKEALVQGPNRPQMVGSGIQEAMKKDRAEIELKAKKGKRR